MDLRACAVWDAGVQDYVYHPGLERLIELEKKGKRKVIDLDPDEGKPTPRCSPRTGQLPAPRPVPDPQPKLTYPPLATASCSTQTAEGVLEPCCDELARGSPAYVPHEMSEVSSAGPDG